MKKLFGFAALFAAAFTAMISCGKEDVQKQQAIAVTGEYADLSAHAVTLYGWCYQKEEEGLSAVYGMEYSSTDLTTAAITVRAESKDSDNKYSCKLSGLMLNTKYYYRAYVLFNGVRNYGEVKIFSTSSDTYPIPALVDLGLSSGLKWASCNLGASSPEEYGGYYQWAGTRDVTSTSIVLNWSNCPYHTGLDYSTGWTKYIPSYYPSYWSGSGSPDNKTVLDPEDDVAHFKLGGKWRMPTYAEWTELINDCTWTWKSNYNGTGRNGYLVASKKNGNSIFLPAAGYRYYDYLLGSSGNYWSSSLSTDGPANAYYLYFHSGSVDTNGDRRYDGQSVRPVSE